MLQRSLIGLIATLSPAVLLAPLMAQGSSGTPNVLVIIADDLGVDILDSYGLGTNRPSTPNIDALASTGVVFENAWSSPLCSPARACIQTGRYGFRTGIGTTVATIGSSGYALPMSEITIPEMLDGGTGGRYAHAAIGKWHLGNDTTGGDLSPNLAGFSHFSGTLGNLDDYFQTDLILNGVRDPVSAYAPTLHVNEALRWLRTAPEPWYLQLSFHAPHKPYHAPPDWLHSVDLSNAGPPSQDPRPYFNAMVEAMDTEIGRLLSGLGAALGNTTILFLGDNGTVRDVILPPFNVNHGKLTLYDGGVNVPFIVSGASVTAPGTRSQALIHAVDVYATVADIAGVDLSGRAPEHEVDGRSLLPFLRSAQHRQARRTIISEKFLPNGAVNGLLPPPLVDGCQPNLGYQGPGRVALKLCGGPLNLARQSVLTVSGAPPLDWGLLLISDKFNPTPMYGGQVTPMPLAGMTLMVTDAQGRVTVPGIGTGSGIRDVVLYLQMLMHDPSQAQDFAISNTVRAHFLPVSAKAIRNQRYKLILRIDQGQPDEFYDLWVDPFESQNLLLDSLTQDERDHLAALTDELMGMISSDLAVVK